MENRQENRRNFYRPFLGEKWEFTAKSGPTTQKGHIAHQKRDQGPQQCGGALRVVA